MAQWNPWHGCHKFSEGCANCYVYRIDAQHGRDSSKVFRTAEFDLPLRRSRGGEYKIAPGEIVYTCFSSDFFVEDADDWRARAWEMMRRRSDLRFLFITKRIQRFYECVPDDWAAGYDNVSVCCTTENQRRADERLPIYVNAPIKHRQIICEPLLGPVDLSAYLGNGVAGVVAGGESGEGARVCDYDWVLALREQCAAAGVGFYFKQTGALFRKDGRVWRVPRRFQHEQAFRANINIDYGE